jgi:mono/diheme cytochrome c family protein
MTKIMVCIISVAFCILPLFSAYSAEKQTEPVPDAKPLFEKKCSICHGLDRPQSKRKTQSEWTDTVTRMKNTNKAPVNDAEANTIIEYLAKNYGK